MREKGIIGLVQECLPNLLYRVEMPDGNIITCYLAGKMKLNKIKVLVGDKVEVILDPYGGKSTNRIIFRV